MPEDPDYIGKGWYKRLVLSCLWRVMSNRAGGHGERHRGHPVA